MWPDSCSALQRRKKPQQMSIERGFQGLVLMVLLHSGGYWSPQKLRLLRGARDSHRIPTGGRKLAMGAQGLRGRGLQGGMIPHLEVVLRHLRFCRVNPGKSPLKSLTAPTILLQGWGQ